ncbi:multidrug effflux MFS transporter [Neisseriaceae bacterium B1]
MYHPTHLLSRKQMAALLALLIAVMPFSIDAYLPALPQIADSLQVDIHLVEKSLSSFIFGAAIGQLLGGSLSDIKGRRNIALTGLAVYIVASCVLIFVQNANQLIATRVLQAIGAGMAAVTSGAIVRDNYHGRDAAQMFALIGIIMMAAPLLAPLVGSMLQAIGGWRSIFGFLFVYGIFVAVMLFRFLPQHKEAEPITVAQVKNIGLRYAEILKTKPALGFLAYQAASFTSMMVFLTESPFVYMKLYELSSHQYAWLFGGNIAMMMVCNRLTAWGLRHEWETRDLLKVGVAVQFCANLALLLSVLIFRQPSLYVIAPLMMVSVGTQGLIVANTQALFMSNFHPEIGGSANAILAAIQSLTGSLIGFTATLLHNGTALVMVAMMFCSTTVGAILLFTCSKAQLFRQPESR